ncbi:MAG TPA: hypothetical protein VI643_07080 [Planctomycetota bacterium]|nr:hypothetical protein [Planctomycetota bacterium]
MGALTAVLVLGFAVQDAPKAGVWKDTLDKAKTEAASRGYPILLFVADKSESSKQLVKNFEDPELAVLIKFFVCCYLHPDISSANVRAAYIPWIAASASEQYKPPLITFGDSKGNPRQEFRSEEKLLSPAQLKELLEKALKAISPEAADAARLEDIRLSKLPRHVQHLETSLTVAKGQMTKETADAFKKEIEWTSAILKLLDPKFGDLKDKEKKEQAKKLIKELGKKLGAMGTYRGRDQEKFDKLMEEAEKHLAELKPFSEG